MPIDVKQPLEIGWKVKIGYCWHHRPDKAHKSQNNIYIKQASPKVPQVSMCFSLPQIMLQIIIYYGGTQEFSNLDKLKQLDRFALLNHKI